MEFKDNYDAVIIGAGVAGLTAGNYIAKKGKSVLLLEQHIIPGGYVSGFKRKGFYFDAGDMSFGSFGIIFPMLEAMGLKDVFDFRRADYRMYGPGLDVKIDSITEVRDAIKKVFPDDPEGIDAYFGEIDEAIQGVDKGGFVGLQVKYGDISGKELAEKHLKDPKALEFLGGMGYKGWSAMMNIGFWYSWIKDYWYPMGGLQFFADKLAENIEKQGGQIAYKSTVTKILVNDGAAEGVELKDGTVIKASKVISACDMKQTFINMVGTEHLDQEFVQKLEKAEPSESMAVVFLGVDMSGEEMKKHMKTHHVLCFKSYKPGNYDDLEDIDVHGKSFLEITCPSIEDPSLAPEGKSSIVLQTISNYDWMDTWRTGPNRERTEAYQALKEKVANDMIGIAETVIPGLKDKIVFKDVGSPLTHERYTGNFKGASAGWSWNVKGENIPFKKNDMVIKTPIKDLFAIGHWVTPTGGGVPTGFMTGMMVANMV